MGELTMATATLDSSRPQTVSIRQAAALARVSRRTIYNWLAAGKLTYHRTASGKVRIVATTLFRPGSTDQVPLPEAVAPLRHVRRLVSDVEVHRLQRWVDEKLAVERSAGRAAPRLILIGRVLSELKAWRVEAAR